MRCSRCLMPDSRPGSVFVEDVCQACLNYDARDKVDWEAREKLLNLLCNVERGKHPAFDVLIPVSGGKDSHALCHFLIKERGLRALLYTVQDHFRHTKAGQANLQNLQRKFGAPHEQFTPSWTWFRETCRKEFEEYGEPLRSFEKLIYEVPIRFAKLAEIPLVFFGENSAYEYGTTAQDSPIREAGVYYMSYYRPWSSMTNLAIAKSYGFRTLQGEWERRGAIESFEQMDCYAYMVHLWMKFPKFGFQRVSDVVSRRIREGHLTREAGELLINAFDSALDPLAKADFCSTLGYTDGEFWDIVNKHTIALQQVAE